MTKEEAQRIRDEKNGLDRGALVRMFPKWPDGWNWPNDARGFVVYSRPNPTGSYPFRITTGRACTKVSGIIRSAF